MHEQNNLSPCVLRETSANAGELRETAERIKDRDRRLYEGARTYWLQTGQDLIRAKELLGHGNFEAWCASELSYSKSKAEKLMRAAEVFGPHLKSVTVTDLPQPTVLYALSAPSVPLDLRNKFIPRIIAGQQVGSEVRQAIKRHRDKVKREEPRAVLPPQAQIDHEQREAQRAEHEPLLVKQEGSDSTPAATRPEAGGTQPGTPIATTALVAPGILPAVEAAQEAVHIIIPRLGSDRDQLAEMLERADPNELVRRLLSALQTRPTQPAISRVRGEPEPGLSALSRAAAEVSLTSLIRAGY